MNTATNLQTTRLELEPLSEKDASFIFELLNTEGWIKFIGNRNIKTIEDAIAYINKINSKPEITYWTVRLKTNKTAIGLITLIKRDYLEHEDIGFAFLPAYSSNGFAYEASKAVLDFLVTNRIVHQIHAVTLPENKSSIKLIEKLGLSFDKQLEIDNEVLLLYTVKLLNNNNE